MNWQQKAICNGLYQRGLTRYMAEKIVKTWFIPWEFDRYEPEDVINFLFESYCNLL